ncbi:hypothetical protein RSOLAG1IB_08278 [Rhizoctonia solani AG-1 IB]|uniref:Uncharacterized protein n=1 Tax=Thanatephorus cucumeris (strain AG1-IB / isolate 7/3/14) TaxID=1108050 RepID=A0A0B7FHB5_THACB|nr:hypothetical protein RSOLAG1IB_08278 [Rhizoctonia solani AG-1 IB]
MNRDIYAERVEFGPQVGTPEVGMSLGTQYNGSTVRATTSNENTNDRSNSTNQTEGGIHLDHSSGASARVGVRGNTVGGTRFTDRQGTYRFQPPTQTNSWRSLVNSWHQVVYGGLPVEYTFVETPGRSPYDPEWTATPTILGELHPAYRATAQSVRAAAEQSAMRIASSGHC